MSVFFGVSSTDSDKTVLSAPPASRGRGPPRRETAPPPLPEHPNVSHTWPAFSHTVRLHDERNDGEEVTSADMRLSSTEFQASDPIKEALEFVQNHVRAKHYVTVEANEKANSNGFEYEGEVKEISGEKIYMWPIFGDERQDSTDTLAFSKYESRGVVTRITSQNGVTRRFGECILTASWKNGEEDEQETYTLHYV